MGAEERVTRKFASGAKEGSEFWLHGHLVGRAYWNEDGSPSFASGLHEGRCTGYVIEYHDGGGLFAEPFVNGLLHGWAKQWSARGRLLLMSPFKRGTGIDFFCDDRGRLVEEHPMIANKPSGIERWWNFDQKTIYEETYWADGHRHGISRYWRDGSLDLRRTKFIIRDETVSKRTYLAAAKLDSSLVPYTHEADSPARALPPRFLELKRLTHRYRQRAACLHWRWRV